MVGSAHTGLRSDVFEMAPSQIAKQIIPSNRRDV